MDMNKEKVSAEADSFINWGSGRAFALGLIPGDYLQAAFTANEAYMFYRLGALYKIKTDQSMLSNFIACLGSGASRLMIGKVSAAIRAPLYAGITFAFGKAAKAFFKSNMTLDGEELQKMFSDAKDEAKECSWQPTDN